MEIILNSYQTIKILKYLSLLNLIKTYIKNYVKIRAHITQDPCRITKIIRHQ